jgi:hypothetical protein
MYLGPHSDDGKPSTSRRALRKEELKEKEFKRDANIGIYNEEVKRGISTSVQINMATLEVRRNKLEMRRMEMAQQSQGVVLLNMHMQLQNMYRMLDRAESRAKMFAPSYDPDNYLWKTVHEQELNIEEFNDRINKMITNVEKNGNKRKLDDISEDCN